MQILTPQTQFINGAEPRIDNISLDDIALAISVAEQAVDTTFWSRWNRKKTSGTCSSRIRASRENLQGFYGPQRTGLRRFDASRSSTCDPQRDISTIIECVRMSLERQRVVP